MKHLFPAGLLLLALPVMAQESLSLSGSVQDRRAKAVAGATIRVLNTGRFTLTDEQGRFAIAGMPAGTYTIQISAVGFATLSQQIVAAAGEGPVFTLTDASAHLDAVLVTAQKKEEWLSAIPLSITALPSEQVRNYRLWNSNHLTAIVPNLYSADPGDGRNVTSIRGITTTSYDPAVATYIDGVNQFGLDTYIAQLFDIDRIEVLRGPQGTLYGRNAMGGVINIITQSPTEFRGAAEASVGNYGLQRYSVTVRGPLVKDKLFAGMAMLYEKQAGFYTNDKDGSDFDRQRSAAGNYFLKYLINRRWSAQLNFKHQNNRNHGTFPLAGDITQAFGDPFHLNQNAVTEMHDNTYNASLSVQYSGKRFNFSSQTAYQSNYRYYNDPIDGDFSPIDGVTIINNYGRDWNNVKAWTQEFRLTSPATASRLSWTTGVYLFLQESPVKQATRFGEDADLVGAPDKNFSIINTSRGKGSGVAVYGQSTWSVSSAFDITFGMRYDYEHKKQRVLSEYQQDPDPDPVFAIIPDTSATASFHAFSPKLGVNWHIGTAQHVYATYSRGYRAGGLTQLSSDPSQPPLYEYKPEFSSNWELGMKGNWWKDRLRMHVAAFYTRVNDAQVPTLVLPDAVTITRNAGKLESKGVEVEMAARPLRNLEANGSFGYTHARYKSLKVPRNGAEEDLAGNRQLFTPEITSMLALQYVYEFDRRKQWRVQVRGEWMYFGQQYFDLANNIRQSPYHLLNTRFGVASPHIEIMGWVRNAGDALYIAYAYDFGAVHLGNPRQYGLTLRVNM